MPTELCHLLKAVNFGGPFPNTVEFKLLKNNIQLQLNEGKFIYDLYIASKTENIKRMVMNCL
jgi:hypothetical protein